MGLCCSRGTRRLHLDGVLVVLELHFREIADVSEHLAGGDVGEVESDGLCLHLLVGELHDEVHLHLVTRCFGNRLADKVEHTAKSRFADFNLRNDHAGKLTLNGIALRRVRGLGSNHAQVADRSRVLRLEITDGFELRLGHLQITTHVGGLSLREELLDIGCLSYGSQEEDADKGESLKGENFHGCNVLHARANAKRAPRAIRRDGLFPACRARRFAARMTFGPPVVIPLLSGLGYAMAALFLKRATEGGTGPWRAAFIVNCVQALAFAPFWLLGGGEITWERIGHAVIAGFTFFIGQIFTFFALSRGDVSVTTPVLGTKVILVALFTVTIVRQPLPAIWWSAVFLTALATALLGGGKRPSDRSAYIASIVFGLPAAAAFALTDVFCQMWAPAFGFGHFSPIMFLAVAVFSVTLVPFFHAPLHAIASPNWKWLIGGAVLIAIQASGVAFSIIRYGNATTTNILYNTRAVWSVLLVWSIGHWFANTERDQGHGVMGRRLIGSALLLLAIVLVVRH